ncbi:MAG TPA: ribose-phosphate pyrophosphokinase [Smithellaceae bacterium]|jgi:ribose-phosphate pyrophosphokinase|nr:MAG: Ribose-phosphate pyrophosphokinase [Deltaproteobacteria bacterium ADurb.BinA014]HNT90708.1 ribose-phosphate pyrophosphokinase [Smithellaceae bacterium]HNV64536.1 ribose-phosphate pyrophosphokinase [Smithellaceae bacterium]HNZ30458.1 ribose-phosphate pyrophosphokinase [Smithellaceae bacterium]HOD30324.1 ribose-phosphate pyrophosphokinase [Smithellaceae bacterium]
MLEKIRIFSGNSNIPLAKDICKKLGVPLGKANVTTFSDGETQVEINENVRGMDVFIIQSTCSPVNVMCMELLIMIDAMKRASADRITAVIPYYGYARQDRKVAPRAPISAKLIADLITTAGANRVLSMDLHAGQIQGFFNIPVDNLFATPVLLEYMKHNYLNDTVVVSPDTGGVERARAFGKRMEASLAIIDKRREGPNESQVMNIVGNVKDKKAIILDDMIDTAGTVTQAAEALKKAGAMEVCVCCTHPVLSGPALDRLETSEIKEVIVTDTIPLTDRAKKIKRIKVLSVAGLLSEAVRRIYYNDSVSSLFI